MWLPSMLRVCGVDKISLDNNHFFPSYVGKGKFKERRTGEKYEILYSI